MCTLFRNHFKLNVSSHRDVFENSSQTYVAQKQVHSVFPSSFAVASCFCECHVHLEKRVGHLKENMIESLRESMYGVFRWRGKW